MGQQVRQEIQAQQEDQVALVLQDLLVPLGPQELLDLPAVLVLMVCQDLLDLVGLLGLQDKLGLQDQLDL